MVLQFGAPVAAEAFAIAAIYFGSFPGGEPRSFTHSRNHHLNRALPFWQTTSTVCPYGLQRIAPTPAAT
jgi:hypothetical protein